MYCLDTDVFFFVLQGLTNSTELHNYNAGVQMGCWGLVIYAATAAVCSGKGLSPLRSANHAYVMEPDTDLNHNRLQREFCY